MYLRQTWKSRSLKNRKPINICMHASHYEKLMKYPPIPCKINCHFLQKLSMSTPFCVIVPMILFQCFWHIHFPFICNRRELLEHRVYVLKDSSAMHFPSNSNDFLLFFCVRAEKTRENLIPQKFPVKNCEKTLK